MSERRSQPRPMLNAEQVGEMLGFRKAYVLELARKREIPHMRVGKYVRFDADAIAAWCESRMIADEGSHRAA